MTRIAKILAEEGLKSPGRGYRKAASDKIFLEKLIDTFLIEGGHWHSLNHNEILKLYRAFPEALSRGNWEFSCKETSQYGAEEFLYDAEGLSRNVYFEFADIQEVTYTARIPPDKLFGKKVKVDSKLASKIFQKIYNSHPESFENLVMGAIKKAGIKEPEEIARQYFSNTVEEKNPADFEIVKLILEAQPPKLSFVADGKSVIITLKVEVDTKDVEFFGVPEPEEYDPTDGTEIEDEDEYYSRRR